LKKFSESIGKIINYPLLAENLSAVSIKDNIIVDFGSGDCSLIEILRKKYHRDVLGVELDEEKVKYGKDKGFKILKKDVRSVSKDLNSISQTQTIHAGFCLLNIFPISQVSKLIEDLYQLDNIKEIFVEIQNSYYFSKKYPPNVKFEKKLNNLKIISWNTPYNDPDGKGVSLNMEYHDESNNLINSTFNVLYAHDLFELINISKNVGFKYVQDIFWPVRYGLEGHKSHHYIHMRK